MIRSQSYCFLGIITIYFFFCLCPFPNTFASSTTRTLCRRDQRDALLELHKEFLINTDGNNYVSASSWNNSVDCCTWNGVWCDTILGVVTSLFIRNSTTITKLKFNSAVFKLQHLTELDFSYCSLQGVIPSSIGNLSHLTSLDLSVNHLVGEIPATIGNLNQLSYMSLFVNNLKVEVIDGASLNELNLASNSFQGPFPQWICKLRFLKTLDLSNNRFTGSIPGCVSHLASLNLRNNSLSGFIPDLCINGSISEQIDLSHNNLVGKLPKSLINCSYMDFLNVKGNKIKDTFPFCLGSLQELKVLVLGANAFYGPVYNPSVNLGFPSLRIIDISDNNFVGSLPEDYFASWSEMSSVWIVGYDDYYVFFSNLRSYASIDLVYKGVHTDFPRIFQGFKAIDFSGNRFSGHIPKSIGLLSDLRLLNLSGNTFTGNIPPSVANITKLETLDLSQNNFSGEIPQELGKLTFLSNINFSYNHLRGLVPQSTQFGSQNCSSFMGNPELHGLEKICG